MAEYDYWYWRDVREQLLKRDGCCGYCGVELDIKTITIDHMIPTSRGGARLSLDNMVASCKQCNNEKADMTPLEFINKKNNLFLSPRPICNVC